jgi:hypothetical protein
MSSKTMKSPLSKGEECFVALLLAMTIILSSCTNWKAKFVQTQADLDNCLNAPENVTVQPMTMQVNKPSPTQSDTIDFVDIAPPVINEAHDSKPVKFDRIKYYAFFTDTTAVYFTISNRLENNRLLQIIQIDSMQYECKDIIKTKIVKEVIRETNLWKGIGIGFIGGLVLFLGLAVGYWYIKRK